MMSARRAPSAPWLGSLFAVARLAVAGPAVWCAGAGMALCAPAAAQVKDTTPYSAVSTGDKVPVKCGDGLYYKVAELKQGQVVQVDGEGPGWLRIALPAGTGAFVPAEAGSADESAGTVKLTKPSALVAFNLTTDESKGHWKALLAQALPEGATLKLDHVIKDGTSVVGFKVIAPAGAKGYVESKFLRRASTEEAPSAAPSAAAPPKSTTVPAPAETKPAAAPTGAKPAESKPGVLEPMVPPGSPPVQAAEPAAKPVTIDQGATAKVENAPVDPVKRRVGTLEELESAFQSIKAQPEASAELDALYGEFQRAADQASTDPKYRTRKVALERRRDYIKLRMDARDAQRKLEDVKKSLDEGENRLKMKIAELESQRVYTIIGLLVPSTVYDGKRLPLMYRLQAVGQTAPPTIGYIAPKAELQLDAKLGMVVGVIGEQVMDRSMKLNVIDPMRVDVLTGSPGSGEVHPETPAPKADGALSTAEPAKAPTPPDK